MQGDENDDTNQQPDTDLGFAMLIAEDEEGHYEALGVAGTATGS